MSRRRAPGKTTQRRLTAEDYRAWWLRRFSLAELRELAAGLEDALNDHSLHAQHRPHGDLRRPPEW